MFYVVYCLVFFLLGLGSSAAEVMPRQSLRTRNESIEIKLPINKHSEHGDVLSSSLFDKTESRPRGTSVALMQQNLRGLQEEDSGIDALGGISLVLFVVILLAAACCIGGLLCACCCFADVLCSLGDCCC